MSLETDLLVDRRRLRRKLSVWRVLAFLAIAAVLVVAIFAAGGKSSFSRKGEHIARVKLTGFVGDQTANLKLFDDIAESGAKAVVVIINSPGRGDDGRRGAL